MKLTLIGDSNSAIVLEGSRVAAVQMQGGPIAGAKSFFSPFFKREDDGFLFTNSKIAGNYQIWKERTGVEFYHPANRLITSMGLSAASFFGRREFIDFPHRHFSDEVLVTAVSNLQAGVIDFYRFCIERGILLCAIAGPAPQERHRAVIKLGKDRVLRLQKLFCAPVLTFLSKNNVPVIDLPETKADGMLLPEYWGKDWAHGNSNGNSKFGAAIALHIKTRFSDSEPH
jgi:hypothetical protein